MGLAEYNDDAKSTLHEGRFLYYKRICVYLSHVSIHKMLSVTGISSIHWPRSDFGSSVIGQGHSGICVYYGASIVCAHNNDRHNVM